MCSYLRLKDSDNEFVDDCCPTFNQLTRQGACYTDSDMPYLVDPDEIQSIADGRTIETERTPPSRRLRSIQSDTDTSSWADPTEIQEMIARHDSLIEEGWLANDDEPYWQQVMEDHESQTAEKAGAGSDDREDSADTHRTGGGAFYQPARRWKPVARRGREGLIGEPIDPQRGQSIGDIPKEVVTIKADTPEESENTDRDKSGHEVAGVDASESDKSDCTEDINAEQGDDETQRSRMSISLSVSEVETSVLDGPQLDEMITRDAVEETGWNPVTVEVKFKEAKKPLRQFRKGKGSEVASPPSTRRSAAKAGKKEIKATKREKEEVTKTEVATCARMDTPSGLAGRSRRAIHFFTM